MGAPVLGASLSNAHAMGGVASCALLATLLFAVDAVAPEVGIAFVAAARVFHGSGIRRAA